MKNCKINLVIGNGFDLSLGLKTGYRGFYESIANNFILQNKDHGLIQYIQNSCERKNWYDFESVIKKYALESEDSKKLQQPIIEFDLEDRKKRMSISESTHYIINELRGRLFDYLKPQDNPSQRLNMVPAKLLFCVLGLDCNDLETVSNSITQINYDQLLDANVPSKVITFNYTDAFWIAGWQVMGRNPNILHRATVCLKGHFWFIHNPLFFENSNGKESIVFGTDDDDRIPAEFYFLKKATQYNREDRKMQFAKYLSGSELVIIYGHSIHGLDYEYYEDWLKMDLNQRIVIITGTEKDVQLIRMKMEREKVKRHIEYIYMMGDVDEEYKKYNQLLEDVEYIIKDQSMQ